MGEVLQGIPLYIVKYQKQNPLGEIKNDLDL
jgi:hypothetical protein